MLQANGKRMSPNAGIAIGPILFIIAILAILAAAIAAGSGSFTGGTTTESNKTKSSALVQIGENLKLGMDEVTMEGGIAIDSVDIDITHTSGTGALFSPTGGGIAPPSTGLANNPAVDKWAFPRGVTTGFGSQGTAYTLFAVLPVSRGVCAEVNNRSVGVAAVPPGKSLGTLVSYDPGSPSATINGNWPTAAGAWTSGPDTTLLTALTPVIPAPTLVGAATGCIYDTDVAPGTGCGAFTAGVPATPTGCSTGPTSQFFFYQVLAIQ